jgi:hypothetical protein
MKRKSLHEGPAIAEDPRQSPVLPETAPSAGQAGSAPSTGGDPEALLARIRELVTDDFVGARLLAREAAARFPQHAGLRNARRVLDEGRATVVPDHRDVTRDEEFRWLSNPPQWARGKWVALDGGSLVAAADSLDELASALESRQLPTPPLVHLVD